MSETLGAVLRALRSDGAIPRDQVQAWMSVEDLPTRAAVYALTEQAWSRIRPSIPGEIQCPFMASYLLACIEQNPKGGEHLHSGFEAAYEFAAWLKHLLGRDAHHFIRDAASGLEAAFRRGDAQTRNRIETGALEHIFEAPGLRPFFAHWQHDPQLADSYSCALDWGIAHDDQ